MSARALLTKIAAVISVLTLVVGGFIVTASFASAATIPQGFPTSGTIDVAGSSNYALQLAPASFNSDPVTFTATPNVSSPAGIELNNPGTEIVTTGALAVGTYTLSGSDSDSGSDTGSWTYTLTVTDTIVQGSPLSGSTTVAGSSSFTDILATSTGYGSATFVLSSQSAGEGFTITSGDVLGTSGPLSTADSPYTITGTDSDANSDTGTWTYTLAVTDTIVQGTATSGTTTTVGSASFTSLLNVASGSVGPVTFVLSSPSVAAGFTITNGDVLGTAGSLTSAGSPYIISGTDDDANGDTGNWSYSLAVTPVAIVQGSPTSGATTTTNSSVFTTTLNPASGSVGPVTFVVSSQSAGEGFTITSGDVLGTSGPLSTADSPYTITGTDSDAYGDTGTWTYSLDVLPAGSKTAVIQTSPTSGTVANSSSGTFATGPITVEDNLGDVTFVTTKTSSALTVSASGLISTTGPLAIGTYSVSGVDSDAAGDTGTWTYTLTVTGVAVTVTFDANGGIGSMAPESASEPTALTLNDFTRAGYTFVDWNTSANGSGASYTNGSMFPFTTATTLFAQWKKGKVPSHRVIFRANGGTGAMSPEVDDTPTAISENRFSRTGYTFVDWDTTASGSGVSFRSGETYSFKKSLTLYAQWRKAPAKSHVVMFSANGGVGTMAVERHAGPAGLTLNLFRRAGYTFVAWNTAANGSGAAYENGATYSFAASTTLYAQWKKVLGPPVHVVIFSANGGVGTMAVERHAGPAGLTLNLFTRAGYTFVAWNTAANGLGVSYANGATYSFAASTYLYAQWAKEGGTVPPTTGVTEVSVGPFGLTSSSLTSALESQIQTLANDVMADKDSQIALTGYGDKLSPVEERKATLLARNVELGRTRAQTIATYLEGRLGALGLKGWSISISGIGAVTSSSDQSEASTVIATLS